MSYKTGKILSSMSDVSGDNYERIFGKKPMVEKLVRENLNERDARAEQIKEESADLLEGVTLTSLDSIADQLSVIGKSFVESHLETIQGTALDGMELAESIELESVAKG